MKTIRLFGSWVLALALVAGGVGCAAETSSSSDVNIDESGDQLLAGRQLEESEVADILRTAGFPEEIVPAMVCTAKHESSFFEKATNRNNNGSIDRGLFQINSIHLGNGNCPTSADPLFSAATNAKCALTIFKQQTIKAWYGYKSHKSECDNYKLGGAPAQGVSTASGSSQPRTPATCFSFTLQSREDTGVCVQAIRDSKWYQCNDGSWHAASPTSGPAGACSDAFPLQ